MSETTRLFLGLMGVLTTASAVAGVLSWRAPKPLSSTLVNLNARIKAWWIMVGAMCIAFLFGKEGGIVLFALSSYAVFCLQKTQDAAAVSGRGARPRTQPTCRLTPLPETNRP